MLSSFLTVKSAYNINSLNCVFPCVCSLLCQYASVEMEKQNKEKIHQVLLQAKFSATECSLNYRS